MKAFSVKFKHLAPVLGALLWAGAAISQTAPAAPAPDPAFSASAFRSHVEFLADDLLEGRATGTRGFDVAARYVASELEGLGLEPGADGRWFQPVPLVRYALSGTPTLSVGGEAFAHGRDFLLRASPDAEALSLAAPLAFAGWGLDLPARGFDDYRGLDVRGKIVVVLNGTPDDIPSDVAAHLNAEKGAMAARRGAVGMILLRTLGETDAVPWERLARFGGRPGITWMGGDGRPFATNGLRFVATAGPALAAALFRGAPRPLDGLLAEASRPGDRPAGFALPATARIAREGARLERFASANVIGLLPGSDPALAGQYVLLMAHLDGLGVAEPGSSAIEAGDAIRNGAMDNASGVATLIEVARAMAQPGNRPRRPILFAAVTGEEIGLLGSSYLAANPVADGRIVSVVNLDMPVLTYDFQDVTAFGAEHSALGPVVARAAARMHVQVSPDPLPEEGLFTRSDHYSFVRRGIPSVFLMTGFAGEGRQLFTRFLDTRYHTVSDDLTLPFDWAAGAKFAQLNYLIAREIADEPEPPLWYADSFFGAAVGAGQRLAQRPVEPRTRTGRARR